MNDMDLTQILQETARRNSKYIPIAQILMTPNYNKEPRVAEDILDQYKVEVNLIPLKEILENQKSDGEVKYYRRGNTHYAEKEFSNGDYSLEVVLKKNEKKEKTVIISMYARYNKPIDGVKIIDLSNQRTGLVLTNKSDELLLDKGGRELKIPFNVPVNGVTLRYTSLPSDEFVVRLYPR